jgi:hypothetical protein
MKKIFSGKSDQLIARLNKSVFKPIQTRYSTNILLNKQGATVDIARFFTNSNGKFRGQGPVELTRQSFNQHFCKQYER